MQQKELHWPTIWIVLFPTLFSESRVESKHSTSTPSSTGSAGALSVDVKGPLAPNPLSGIAWKGWLVPLGIQVLRLVPVKCDRGHRLVLLLLLPFTLQTVVPVMSPVTVHLKVKVSPGQVGGGAVNCPATWPGEKGPWKHLLPPWVHKLGYDDLTHYNLVQVWT